MTDVGVGKKVLFTSLVVLVMLGACEAAVRVRGWMRYGSAGTSVRDPMLVYDADADLFVPRPGYQASGNRIGIKINSLGFRGDEFTVQKPPNTIRIVCLGASTTFNAEVSTNDATWPHQLQDKLRAAYPGRNIEVINAAVGGYTAAENLRNLKHRVLRLDPDLVIYYEANNEIVKDTQEIAEREGLVGVNRVPPVVATLSRYSVLADLAFKNIAILARSRDDSTRKLNSVPPDLPNHFVSLLDDMRMALAERNIPLVVSTFIVKYRRHQDRATQIANADVAFYYMPWMSIDGMLDAMDKYNAAIIEYGASHGVATVDDREAIPPDAEHFSDCMHLLDKGAERMADRFLRYLRASDQFSRLVAATQAVPVARVHSTAYLRNVDSRNA